jgi:hypothetical protein
VRFLSDFIADITNIRIYFIVLNITVNGTCVLRQESSDSQCIQHESNHTQSRREAFSSDLVLSQCILLDKSNEGIIPHLPAQPALYHPPESHPSSSLDYHETATSNLPPPRACSTTTSSNACVAVAVHGPYMLYARARRGCLIGIGCRQCQGSYAELA